MDADAEFIEHLLADGSALTLEQIDDARRAAGLPSLPTNSIELLVEQIPSAAPVLGERWVRADAVLAGRVFTHDLSQPEHAADIVSSEPDLVALEHLAISRLLTLGGHEVDSLDVHLDAELLADFGLLTDEIDSALMLPEASLAAFAPTDRLAVRLTPELELDLSATSAVDADRSAATARLLHDLLEEHAASAPVSTDELLLAACVADADAFRVAVAPVGELLDRAGIVRRRTFVAPVGFDLDAWEYEADVSRATVAYGLDEAGARAAVDLAMAVDAIAELLAQAIEAAGAASEGLQAALDRLTPPELPTLSEPVQFALRRLADPDVATAVLAMTLGSQTSMALPLSLAVAQWRDIVPRASRPALHWIEGKVLERMGNHADAERAYDQAETIDPSWGPALVELARFASDRGDATRAVALLQRAQVADDDDELSFLAGFVPGDHVIDRNAPCWCGSGRRVKACHRSAPPLPLEQRAGWLHHKAVMFLQEGPWREDLLRLATARSRHWPEREALWQALADPFVHDTLLAEGEVFADFVAERGYLLPADELDLAESWLGIERSVFDVEQVTPGAMMTLRDLRTGERIDVTERTATRVLREGMLIVTRVLPCGGQWQVFGGIEPISLMQRREIIELLDDEPEPLEVVEAMSARFAPPTMTTTTGEPLQLCRATIEVDDLEAFLPLLTDRYEQAADELIRVVDGSIRANLRLSEGRIVVETLSRERMDDELLWLAELPVPIRIVEQQAVDADDLLAQAAPAAGKPAMLDPTDPALADVLAELIAGYETRWLDEHIPALDGLTPREAAADPTRRPDLVRLLATWPDTDEGMSGRRLAAALGLDEFPERG